LNILLTLKLLTSRAGLDRSVHKDDGYLSEKGEICGMEMSALNRQSDVESGDHDKESLLPKTKEVTEEPAASSKAVVFWLLFWMAK
jgi:hypothetical protein